MRQFKTRPEILRKVELEAADCRVWSVAHSSLRPHLCASASDDGTARIWAGRGLAEAAGAISLPRRGAICGASFCSEDENALALAGADCCAYLFDLRKTDSPLQVCCAQNSADVKGVSSSPSTVVLQPGRGLGSHQAEQSGC